MATQHWPAATATPRGRALLVHGLSSLAESWWQVGPWLADLGWEVTAIDQAGHGGRRLHGPFGPDTLVDAVLEQHPDQPDLLIGHSLGTVTAVALLERQPGWAATVILEDPPSALTDGVSVAAAVAETIRSDFASVQADRAAVERRVRADRVRWRDEDVYWAVEGIARMDAEGFARSLESLTDVDAASPLAVVDRIPSVKPAPYVLAARSPDSFMAGGSALSDGDRFRLTEALPPGHLIELAGGHCLHRDDPVGWLAAVARITEPEQR